MITASPGTFSPRRRNSSGRCVLEDAEQPELLAGGSLGANLVVAAHGAVHGLPASAARDLRRWGLSDIVEDRKRPSSDLNRASVQELVDRDATIRLPVIDDVPAQQKRDGVRRSPPAVGARDLSPVIVVSTSSRAGSGPWAGSRTKRAHQVICSPVSIPVTRDPQANQSLTEISVAFAK